MDQVDIHALHKRLEDGDGIMPGYSGQIKRLVILLSAVDWPSELAKEGAALIESLTLFASALADDDLESAVPLASAAHEGQHHFSGRVADWWQSIQMPEEEFSVRSDQSEDGHSSDDSESHGHSDDNGDDDDSNDTHDDGHDHSHGE